jgi:hypothetical protein
MLVWEGSNPKRAKQMNDKDVSRSAFHRYFRKCRQRTKIGQRNAAIEMLEEITPDFSIVTVINQSNPLRDDEALNENGKNQLSRTSTKGTKDNFSAKCHHRDCTVFSSVLFDTV